MLIISRDIAIVLTVTIVNLALGRRTFRPSMLGKAATAVYIFTGLVFLGVNYIGRPSRITDACVYLSLAITVLSALHYIRHAAADHQRGLVAPLQESSPMPPICSGRAGVLALEIGGTRLDADHCAELIVFLVGPMPPSYRPPAGAAARATRAWTKSPRPERCSRFRACSRRFFE